MKFCICIQLELNCESINWVIEYFVQALFDDDDVANSLESLAGTLKAAKRQERKYLMTYFTEIQSTR